MSGMPNVFLSLSGQDEQFVRQVRDLRAADRGVAIRIYLDGTQLAERKPAKVFDDLAPAS
jgi:hypothetical protein